MKSSTSHNSKKRRQPLGVDTVLQSRGKTLRVGQELRIPLVKSHLGFVSSIVGDVISTSRNNGSHSESTAGDEKTEPLQFPVVAKFPESVVRPDFQRMTRFHEIKTPSQKDDTDDEDDEDEDPIALRKKRLRAAAAARRRKGEAPKRQWWLQEETDYLEFQIAQQEQGKNYKLDKSVYSSRYEGLSEYNNSNYMLISLPAEAASTMMGDDIQLEVTLLPTPYPVHSFTQPSASNAMSLTQASQTVQDTQMASTRFKLQHGSHASTNKMRLLEKLKSKSSAGVAGAASTNEVGDDVMSDVLFTERKGTSMAARRELLGDDVKMDVEGVLGGANDAVFGGRRKFLSVAIENGAAGSSGATKQTAASNDGMAMADDFYQRDVKAEYEELDYDANEQFDDDDVDLGQADINGLNEEVEDTDYATDSDENDEDDNGDADGSGDGGLGTTAGLKAMLARARGEVPANKADEENGGAAGNSASGGAGSGGDGDKKSSVGDGDGDKKERPSAATSPSSTIPSDTPESLAQVMKAAEQAREAAAKQQQQHNGPDGSVAASSTVAGGSSTDPNSGGSGVASTARKARLKSSSTGVEVNAQGERLLTLEAVQREIWLHHGAITFKQLLKIFSIKKKSAAERKAKFQELIKELCIVRNDPVQGKMLQLKQHYASLG